MTSTYLNAVAKSCDNCAYQRMLSCGLGECAKGGYLCNTMRKYPSPVCDMNFSGWHPAPPKPKRRSLRAWLYDLFIA